jgi:hypothetical protein
MHPGDNGTGIQGLGDGEANGPAAGRSTEVPRGRRPAASRTGLVGLAVVALCAAAAGGYFVRDLVPASADPVVARPGDAQDEAVASAGSAAVPSGPADAVAARSPVAEPVTASATAPESAPTGAGPVETAGQDRVENTAQSAPQANPARQMPEDRQTLVSEVQRALSTVGLEPGPVDGLMGPKTRDAIMAFQERIGTESDGEIDSAFYRELKAAEAAADARWEDDIPPAHLDAPTDDAAEPRVGADKIADAGSLDGADAAGLRR